MPATPRNTKTITFSLPPEMAEQVKEVILKERRTMSELIREALRNYIEGQPVPICELSGGKFRSRSR